ncbi:GNAT family N-acetyltransferase [Streptomyces sp. NPDC086023]|uniref:GNAT family N-acetyltransferase n=1 Tax=Streptomyces sp. NPDC086023 TaxID=3365746 RepID=UPI0037D5E1FA
MTWTFTHDLTAWLRAAGAFVAARPVENTLILTVGDALRRSGLHRYGERAPVFGWWAGADGEVAGAVLWTPPYPLNVAGLPAEAVGPLAAALASEPLLAGVAEFSAARGDAAALAGAWGRPVEVVEELRLYRLAGLVEPDPVPSGRARPAGPGDAPLLLEWLAAFGEEVAEPGWARAGLVAERLAYGGFTLWEDGGRPVSMAGRGQVVCGTARVAPVYTPPEWRGRGYAAGVTAEVSRTAGAAGAAEVLLFTDLANPTSNGVYRRIGYRPVEDRVRVRVG